MQEQIGNAVLERSETVLIENGIPRSRIERRLRLSSENPAGEILLQAENEGIPHVFVARRGVGEVQSILMGSTSAHVAHYGRGHHVWIADTPLEQEARVLAAVDGADQCRRLARFAAETLVPAGDFEYFLFHVNPPMPAYLWDDGHALTEKEREMRNEKVNRWEAQSIKTTEQYLAEGREILIQQGVAPEKVQTRIVPMKEGVAADIINEIQNGAYRMVLMGKKSLDNSTFFQLGSRAGRILQNVHNTMICMADSTEE
jgi:nucleotide-binding universal stress UspA family protein